jgi:ABC-2 type transport system permease protein
VTAPAPAPAVPDSAPIAAARRPGFGDLLLSEWTKLRSVRSTIWSLILLVVLTLGITILITAITSAQWNKIGAASRAQLLADPVGGILGAGVQFGQLTVIVLGVLVISSEYSTGAIRASLLAVPRRLPMLAAKGTVFAAVVLVVGEVVMFASFFIGAAILHSHIALSLGGRDVARAVLGGGLYLGVLGLFAMAIGTIVRHTAGAITGVIAFVIVLEPLSQLIPGTWGRHIHDYLPTSAGRLIIQTSQHSDQVLSAWQGFGVFCLWTAVLLAVAGVLLVRRDA